MKLFSVFFTLSPHHDRPWYFLNPPLKTFNKYLPPPPTPSKIKNNWNFQSALWTIKNYWKKKIYKQNKTYISQSRSNNKLHLCTQFLLKFNNDQLECHSNYLTSFNTNARIIIINYKLQIFSDHRYCGQDFMNRPYNYKNINNYYINYSHSIKNEVSILKAVGQPQEVRLHSEKRFDWIKIIICLKDFLWFKKKLYIWIKYKFFDSNKVSLNHMKIYSNQINFYLKSNKLYLWP